MFQVASSDDDENCSPRSIFSGSSHDHASPSPPDNEELGSHLSTSDSSGLTPPRKRKRLEGISCIDEQIQGLRQMSASDLLSRIPSLTSLICDIKNGKVCKSIGGRLSSPISRLL